MDPVQVAVARFRGRTDVSDQTKGFIIAAVEGIQIQVYSGAHRILEGLLRQLDAWPETYPLHEAILECIIAYVRVRYRRELESLTQPYLDRFATALRQPDFTAAYEAYKNLVRGLATAEIIKTPSSFNMDEMFPPGVNPHFEQTMAQVRLDLGYAVLCLLEGTDPLDLAKDMLGH